MKKTLILIVLLITSLALLAEVIWEHSYSAFNADGMNVRPHMQICSDGGYAVTGDYIIEDEWGNIMEWRGYVMKISSEGQMLWADPDTLDFPAAPSGGSDAIIETSDGGLINTGDSYMIKRDVNGNRLWEQDLDIAITTMCYSHDGNIILSGGMPDGYLLFRKIDYNGNELLSNDTDFGKNVSIKRIIPTSDGGYAMTGIILVTEWTFDILIVKTNADGDTLWTHTKDGNGETDQGNWIIENSEQNLFACGEIVYDTRDYLSGYGVMMSLDGEIIWERDTPEEMIGLQQFYVIDIPEDNSLMINAGTTGAYKCDYDYNLEWIEQNNEILTYFQKLDDGYIHYNTSGNNVNFKRTDNDLVNVEDNAISYNYLNLQCYPNPFNPETTISFNRAELSEKFIVSIYNSKGQKVDELAISNKQSSAIWNSENHSSGIYFVTLKTNNQIIASTKITMMK